jgi:hypothetical protein
MARRRTLSQVRDDLKAQNRASLWKMDKTARALYVSADGQNARLYDMKAFSDESLLADQIWHEFCSPQALERLP